MSDSSSSPEPKLEDEDSVNPTADVVMNSMEAGNAHSEEEDANGVHDGAGDTDEDLLPDDNELFGSDSDVDEPKLPKSKTRKLDDEDLDSGDDEGRDDRADHDMGGYGYEAEEREIAMTSISLGRHAIPRGSDGELYLLRYPHFVGIEHKAFTLRGFQPPVTDHHSDTPSSTFSPAQVNNTTIRWRRSPRNPKILQSNSRIIRWSDGSLTMQVGANPMEQYQLPAKPLAPPQHAPIKPTPTTISTGKGTNAIHSYDAQLDSHTYLISAHESIAFAQVTNHVTASLTVESNADDNDDALLRLQESMAAAVKGNRKNADGVSVIETVVDPELAKRQAEAAEKEKMRAQKRRQNQEDRERDRTNRVLGRAGLRNGVGLTVGGLEDDGLASRPRSKPTRRPQRRNSDYSDEDEEYGKTGRSKLDQYDEDDGFLVRSDEEPELMEDESEEESIVDEDEAEEKPKKQAPKEKRVSPGDDASGSAARTKRRRVVDDEED